MNLGHLPRNPPQWHLPLAATNSQKSSISWLYAVYILGRWLCENVSGLSRHCHQSLAFGREWWYLGHWLLHSDRDGLLHSSYADARRCSRTWERGPEPPKWYTAELGRLPGTRYAWFRMRCSCPVCWVFIFKVTSRPPPLYFSKIRQFLQGTWPHNRVSWPHQY